VIFSLFCFLVLAAFLVCLGLFALAVTKVVAPDGKGHARGFVGGCAAMVALFLLCFLGIVGLAATIFAMGVGNIPGWNPIERIEILDDHGHHDDKRWSPSTRDRDEGPQLPRRSIFARFTVRGDAGGELSDLLGRVFELDLERMDDSLRVERRTEPDGSEVAVYEFRLPVREDELERFEENLRRELDGLRVRLPAGVVIEFDGAETR
jgi:hypothetical protein